jgi:hypothetical protein
MKMGTTHINAKIRNSLKASLLLGVMAYAAPAQAKIITYCIVAKTVDETDAGTTGYPEIAMSGEVSAGNRVYSGWKKIGGDQDRDSTDKLEVELEDMGVVTVIDIENTSSNAWKLHYIRIYRDTGCGNTGAADGYSEFSINRWIEDEKIQHLTPTDRSYRSGSVSKDGNAVINKQQFTVAHYASVKGVQEQEVMKFTESWTDVDAISMSTSVTNNIGVSATLTYESPETVIGTFGAAVTADWSRETSKAEEKSREKINESAYDWNFTAPGNTFIIKKATFEVPYAHQLYRSSRDGKAYVVRTVGSKIRPIGDAGSFIEIPQRNNDDTITPISLNELETKWFRYLPADHVVTIKNEYLSGWLANGYVTRGRGGNSTPTSSSRTGSYKKTANAAISGHNNKNLSNVSVGDCKSACDAETSFVCTSFDYAKKTNKCDLSDKRASDVGGLKTNYAGNPYDHYSLSDGNSGQTSPANAPTGTNSKRSNNQLKIGESMNSYSTYGATEIVSANGKYRAVMQKDCNFVLYRVQDKKALWASDTYKKGTQCFLVLQRGDGNLVLYDGQRKPLWATNRYENSPGVRTLVMQDDGNLVLYKEGDQYAVWASGTMQ